MSPVLPLLCADIGGSFIDCAVVEPDGTLSYRHARPTPTHDLDAFLAALEDIAAAHDGLDLHIALAGLQDPATGLCSAANIPCLNGVRLAQRLGTILGRRVRIGNDADCFALAESRLGAGVGHDIVLGIILGTGVGGGLVIQGRLVVGRGGLTGEWGHGPFSPHVPDMERHIPCFPCECGQHGCIDTIGGARGVERLFHWTGGDRSMDSRTIIAAWRDGDRIATRALDLHIRYLASALATAINLTGSTIVPVGGGLSNVPELLDALDCATRQRILRRDTTRLVVRSRLGSDAGLLGAAYL